MSLKTLRYPAPQPSESVDEIGVGQVLLWDETLNGALSEWFVRADGQELNDPSSELNGEIIPNLNGISISKILEYTDGSTSATMSTTKDVYVGAEVSASSVPSGTTIESIDGSTTVTLSDEATSSGNESSTVGGNKVFQPQVHNTQYFVMKIKLTKNTKLITGYTINGERFDTFQKGKPENGYGVYYDQSSQTFKKFGIGTSEPDGVPTNNDLGSASTRDVGTDPSEVPINSDLASVSQSGNHSDLSLDDGTNPHGTTKSDVGLGNVPNWSGSTNSSLGTSDVIMVSQKAIKDYVDNAIEEMIMPNRTVMPLAFIEQGGRNWPCVHLEFVGSEVVYLFRNNDTRDHRVDFILPSGGSYKIHIIQGRDHNHQMHQEMALHIKEYFDSAGGSVQGNYLHYHPNNSPENEWLETHSGGSQRSFDVEDQGEAVVTVMKIA